MFAIISILVFCIIIHYACSMRANEADRGTDDEFWAHMRSFFPQKVIAFCGCHFNEKKFVAFAQKQVVSEGR